MKSGQLLAKLNKNWVGMLSSYMCHLQTAKAVTKLVNRPDPYHSMNEKCLPCLRKLQSFTCKPVLAATFY